MSEETRIFDSLLDILLEANRLADDLKMRGGAPTNETRRPAGRVGRRVKQPRSRRGLRESYTDKLSQQ